MKTTSSNPDNIEIAIKVEASAEHAFKSFTKELHSWWPEEYTWAGEVLQTIEIEPHENGRCFERGPHNFECDWGRVLVWQPPERLVFTWQISPKRVPEPNPDKASEVEIRFKQMNEKETEVEFEHRKFSNHGDHAEEYRAALDSPEGWPFILDQFKKVVAEKAE